MELPVVYDDLLPSKVLSGEIAETGQMLGQSLVEFTEIGAGMIAGQYATKTIPFIKDLDGWAKSLIEIGAGTLGVLGGKKAGNSHLSFLSVGVAVDGMTRLILSTLREIVTKVREV